MATTNHPNRNKGTPSPSHNPKPEEITALLAAHGLTTNDGAALLHTTYRTFIQWETGDRKMHAAFWQHLQACVAGKVTLTAEQLAAIKRGRDHKKSQPARAAA